MVLNTPYGYVLGTACGLRKESLQASAHYSTCHLWHALRVTLPFFNHSPYHVEHGVHLSLVC